MSSIKLLSALGLRRGDWIVLAVLGLGIVFSSIYSLSLLFDPPQGVVAIVEINREQIDRIYLHQFTDSQERTYWSGDGTQFNTIQVEPGRIRVLAANCPEQVDVRTGWLTHPGQVAICLPHRFVLRLTTVSGESDIDTLVR